MELSGRPVQQLRSDSQPPSGVHPEQPGEPGSDIEMDGQNEIEKKMQNVVHRLHGNTTLRSSRATRDQGEHQ